MKIYFRNVSEQLFQKYSIEFVTFNRIQQIPKNVDLYWDPRSGGGQAPYRKLLLVNKPVVTTVHGISLFSLPLSQQFFTQNDVFKAFLKKIRYKIEWYLWRHKVSKIITVSEYSKSDIVKHLNISNNKVCMIWNGYDNKSFSPIIKEENTKPYFFNITSYQKKKNFERLLEAYQMLDENTRPDLIAVVRPYNKTHSIKGLKIITDKLPFEEIVKLYQNALALVFPSLHEGFGLPIIEAMACGIPVITSNITSCIEVAENAAITIDPYSTIEIKEAMEKIISNKALREELKAKGLERAKMFSWENSAEAHLKVFKSVLKS